jgi:hypothetical protein
LSDPERHANQQTATGEQKRKSGGSGDHAATRGVPVGLVGIGYQPNLLHLLVKQNAHATATSSS